MREIWRKVLHVVFGIAVITGAIYLNNTYSLRILSLVLFGLLVGSLIVEFILVDLNWRPALSSLMERESELTGFHGSTYFLVGILVVIQFFPFDIALASIAMLVFGDSAAALIGQKWGTPFYRKKSLHGITAMFIISIASGLLFIQNPLLVIGMAAVATLVEAFVLHLDDNLMIPVFTALAGFGLRLLGL